MIVNRFKYLTLISTLIVTLYMVTAVVQNRIIAIGDFNVCAAIFVYPFSYVLSDICTEIYGYKTSRQIIWCSLLSWLVSGMFISLIISAPTPHFWSNYSKQFNTVMAPYFRTILSGIAAVIAGQFLNIYIIAKLKILMRGRYFWIRSVSSCFFGDAITTLLSISFIFAGRMPFSQIGEIIAAEFFLSIILQAIFAIPSTVIVHILKKSENIDVYDRHINFNPFKFSTKEEHENSKNENRQPA